MRDINYNFDLNLNGNLTLQLVDTERDSSHCADTMGTRVKNHLWDEENRLLAINDNGFISNYFYDANGERTVKLSKPDLYVYVNSAEKLKGDSLTMKFIGYVSPYLVVTNGGRYTKHIYAGTQRIASKLGDIDAFGADPRRVATAGHDVDGAEPIDFGTKYKNQNDAFKARFDSLGAKFNGKSLDDYVNGKSFCCGDNSLDEIEKNNTQSAENAKIEDNLYFYHPDHLGSTSMVTNYDGEVTQNVAYIPYGEVFVEQRNGTWNTPYLFNAKELDEETGLYYYGARYLDPTGVRWLSVDQKYTDYCGASPYNYCLGNPVKMIDEDGKDPNLFNFFDGYNFDFIGLFKSEIQGVIDGVQGWYDKQVHGNSTLKTSLLLTSEFVFSYGPETRKFQNENFSEALKNSNMTTEALKAFQKEYEEYLGGDRANIPPYYRVDFSILYPLEGDTGPFKELWKDGPSIAQFTGTATYYFEVS